MPETRERSALDPRDRLAVMVSMAGSYIESGRGDDALAVMRTVAEDVAAEIARELEEAREEVAEWVQAAIEHAADLLAERRHGESAPDALMAIRHEVAEWVEAEMEKLATPASDGTTRWYCEYGCGCVLDSRAARYHDCRRPASDGGEVRERVGEALKQFDDIRWADVIAALPADLVMWTWKYLRYVRSDLVAALELLGVEVEEGDPLASIPAAILSASGTPPGEGERANCRCAPAAPWRPDGATCPDWPGCGNPYWRPATPEEASGAD